MADITPIEILKNKSKFEQFIEENEFPEVEEVLKDYPKNTVQIKIPNLTQNIESLVSSINTFEDSEPYLIWYVVNERSNILNAAKFFNKTRRKNVGIFIFKAELNDDNKITFKCLLKPDLISVPTTGKSKQVQLEYWNNYFNICDTLAEGDYQVEPKPQHWQYIPLGKTGVSLQLTVNTQVEYIGVDLFISNNKPLFEKLETNKKDIEEKLGELEWINNLSVKSSRIRKVYECNFQDKDTIKDVVSKHIQMAKDFKEVFSKYLQEV